MEDENLKDINIGGEAELYLTGGAIKATSFIGQMEELEKEGFNFTSFSGSSMGGVIAAMKAKGLSNTEILDRMKGYAKDVSEALSTNPLNKGIDKVHKILKNEFGDLRMKDLKFPLIVSATENYFNPFKKTKTKLFSNIETPDILVCDALTATSAYPVRLGAFKMDGKKYHDGGMIPTENPHIPIERTNDKKRVLLSFTTVMKNSSGAKKRKTLEDRVDFVLCPNLAGTGLVGDAEKIQTLYLEGKDIAKDAVMKEKIKQKAKMTSDNSFKEEIISEVPKLDINNIDKEQTQSDIERVE